MGKNSQQTQQQQQTTSTASTSSTDQKEEVVQQSATSTATQDSGESGKAENTGVIDAPKVVQASAPAPTAATAPAAPKLGTMAEMTLNQVTGYVAAMAPGLPVQLKDALVQQVVLYRALTNAINKTDTDFRAVWNTILRLFLEHKDGVFSERYVYRHFDNVALELNDRRAFQRLLNLAILTADPKSRSLALKQIDMQKTLEFGVTEEGRSRILGFYNL